MKTMFVHATMPTPLALPESALKRLPGRIGIVTTVQHLHKIKEVMQQLPGAILAGQVLGCRADTAERIKDKVDAFLYVGTGEFHPFRVALQSGKPVYCWNPLTKTFFLLDQKDIDAYRKQQLKALKAFFNANTVGVIMTVKPGQSDNRINAPGEKLKWAPMEWLERNEKLLGKKKYYVFACDTLSQEQMDNFPFIECWINTACSRIADDKLRRLVNIEDLYAWAKEAQK